MILVIHDVIDIVLLLEGKPMGAVNVQESVTANLLIVMSLMFLYCANVLLLKLLIMTYDWINVMYITE